MGVLTAYFSKSGQNFGAPALRIGYTGLLAGMLHELAGGELFEIRPVEPYPDDLDATIERAQREADQGVFPPLVAPLPEPSGHDAVLLGFPIWGGRPPMAVQGLLRGTDLTGVRLLPFCTHGGSGFGDSLAVRHELCPGAVIERGFAEYGTAVRDRAAMTRRKAEAWLRGARLL